MKFEELNESAKAKAINDLVNFYTNMTLTFNDIKDETIWCANILKDFVDTQKETYGFTVDKEKISFDVSDPAGGDNYAEFEIPNEIPAAMFEFIFKQLSSVTRKKEEKQKIMNLLNESPIEGVFGNQKANSREKNHISLNWEIFEDKIDTLNLEVYEQEFAVSQKTFDKLNDKFIDIQNSAEEKFTDLFNGLAISLEAKLSEEIENLYENAKNSVKEYDYDEDGNIIPVDMREVI